jgi:ATP-binding cassette, subfamily B, bacterial PglK
MILRTVIVTLLWGVIARRLARTQQRRAAELFAAYLDLPYLDLLAANRSRMLDNLRQVSRTLMQDSLFPVLYFLSDALVAGAIVAVLLVLAPGPTVLLAVWLAGVFALIQRFVTRPASALAPQRWAAFRAIAEFDEWSLQHGQAIRVRQEEAVVRARHLDLAGHAASLAARVALAAMLPRYIAELALLSSIAVLFGWFAWQGEASHSVLSQLAIFTLAGMRLLPAVLRGLSMIGTMQQTSPVREGIAADLAARPAQAGSEALAARGDADEPTALFTREIRLDDIAFGYPGGPRIMAPGTTLALGKGEWVHIKGPSGEGKSTLVALLLGFLRPDAGRILFDGEPADPATRLRGPRVAMVAQDSRFLHGTIAENLSFPGLPDQIDTARAVMLMRAMGLDLSLEAHPGQDGAQLSGGQRQRLAIIKAMLKRPDLLILDEATAQLDRGLERTVFDVIRSELPDTTVIVVAHKLDGSARFDRVWEKRGPCWAEVALTQKG